jgi:UDP-glucose-4-epimerase GalE
MNVLVTGGAGYIGSHVCKQLAHAGFTPVTFDNLSNGHREAVKWGPLQVGDVRDTDLVKQTLKTFKIEAVLHFAAFIEVAESVQNPQKYFDNNVNGSLNVLAAMEQTAIDKIVFSSTCAVYGVAQQVPISETHPFNPINPYGQGKLQIEKELASRVNKINSISLRYFNAAGADLDGEIGERHHPESHLIPRALMAILKQGPALEIFGDDYETPDKTCVRDYVHVTDLAVAHVAALQLLTKSDQLATAFNIGSGLGFSIRQVLDEIEKITGHKVPSSWGPRRAGDLAVLVADGRRARETLGWHPQLSDLATIIDSAWKWHREPPW